MSKNKEYITVIDIGSANVRTIIAQIVEEEKPRVIGVGVAANGGMRRGMVTERDEVSEAIKQSVEMAELSSGVEVESAYVSVGGVDLEFQKVNGIVAVGRADSEVSESDVDRAIEASRAINIPPNKEIIYTIAQSFKLDDQEGIKDPVGMVGVRLEMQGIVILASSSNIKNITKCLQDNDIEMDGVIAAPIAAVESALSKRQKELGSVLIDFGAGVTSMIVYEEQEIVDIKIIPIGMGLVTNDIAIGLRTSVDVAEKVKLQYGSSLPKDINKDDKINLSEIDENEEGIVSRYHVAEIIEARMEEILYLVEEELKKINRSALLPAGAILTGGGAYVHGVVDLTKEILMLPAQIGFPGELSGLVDKIDGPEFNVAVGMLLWSLEKDVEFFGDNDGDSKKKDSKKHFKLLNGLFEKISGWVKKFLP